MLQRLLFHFPPHPDTDLDRYLASTTSLGKLISNSSSSDFQKRCYFEEVWDDKFSDNVFYLFWGLSYVIGDKSILQDAGVKDINDVEALPPPPEIKGNIPAQKYMGDVSYFICTRPGRGPVLLGDESLALLSPETGLPK